MSGCTPEPDFRACSTSMYYMYRQYFPLLALTAYTKATTESEEERLRIVRRKQ